MKVYIGSDHGGFAQKELLKEALLGAGHDVQDCGNRKLDRYDDYPRFAARVGRQVARHPLSRGVLFCRSGEGMEMAANKVRGIRAALAWNEEVAAEAREDNDANVLVIPSDFVTDAQAISIARTFLAAPFSEKERHARRIAALMELEEA